MLARVTAAWRRWLEIASLLVNCSIGLRTKGRVYEACVRSAALLYGAETWALTSRLMDVVLRCVGRMPRYMTGVRTGDLAVRWQRCVKLKQRRLIWFGHVKRAEGGRGVLGEMRVKG